VKLKQKALKLFTQLQKLHFELQQPNRLSFNEKQESCLTLTCLC